MKAYGFYFRVGENKSVKNAKITPRDNFHVNSKRSSKGAFRGQFFDTKSKSILELII